MVTALFESQVRLFLALDFDNFAALVETTFGANSMRQAHRTTICAGGQIAGFEGIVGAASIAAAFGNFTLWQWGHATFSLIQESGVARYVF